MLSVRRCCWRRRACARARAAAAIGQFISSSRADDGDALPELVADGTLNDVDDEGSAAAPAASEEEAYLRNDGDDSDHAEEGEGHGEGEEEEEEEEQLSDDGADRPDEEEEEEDGNVSDGLTPPIYADRGDMPTPRAAAAPFPLIRCSDALANAAAHRTPLYLAALPSDVVALVDRLITINAWRWTGTLTLVTLPPLRSGCNYSSTRVVSEGEDLIVRRTIIDGLGEVRPHHTIRSHSHSHLHAQLTLTVTTHSPRKARTDDTLQSCVSVVCTLTSA